MLCLHFLCCYSHFKEFRAIFGELLSPAYFRQKEWLANFSRVDSSSPEDLVVLAELSSPEAGASPRTKHFLPVSFLLLQRMLVGRPDLGLSFQKCRAPGETREPLAGSSESDAVFGKVHSKRQDDVSRQSSSSSFRVSSSHTRTSRHMFPNHFQVRRACHLFQECGAPIFWASMLLHPLPVYSVHPAQHGLALGLKHCPLSPPV